MMKNQIYKYIKYIVKTGFATAVFVGIFVVSNTNCMLKKPEIQHIHDHDSYRKSETIIHTISLYEDEYKCSGKIPDAEKIWSLYKFAYCGENSNDFQIYIEDCMNAFCDLDVFEKKENIYPSEILEACEKLGIDFKFIHDNSVYYCASTIAGMFWSIKEKNAMKKAVFWYCVASLRNQGHLETARLVCDDLEEMERNK